MYVIINFECREFGVWKLRKHIAAGHIDRYVRGRAKT